MNDVTNFFSPKLETFVLLHELMVILSIPYCLTNSEKEYPNIFDSVKNKTNKQRLLNTS